MVFIGYARETTPGLPSSPILKLDEFVDVVKNLHDSAFGGAFQAAERENPSPGTIGVGAAPENSCSEFSEEREAGLNDYAGRKDVLGRVPLSAYLPMFVMRLAIPVPAEFRCATISKATESRSVPCLTVAVRMAS